MGGPSARGAEGVRGSADPLQETVEGRTVAGTELGEDGTVAAGEEFFLLSHHGRGGKEDFVWGSGGDRPGDRPRVKGLDGGFVGVWGDDAAHGVGGDIGEELGLEGTFLGAMGGDVGGEEGTSKGLGAEEGEVVVDGKGKGFGVKMVNGTHLHAAGGYAEGRILNTLEFLNGGGGRVGEPDWGSVGKKGTDEGLESDEEGLLLLAPKGASKGSQNVEAGGGAGYYGVNVGGEGEVGIKGDPQDAGVFGQWEGGGVKGNMGMGVGLVGMGGEDGNGGLWGG